MNWRRGKMLDGAEFTALMHGAVEVGRYWHRADGFVRESRRNNARAQDTERAARAAVIAEAAETLAGLWPTGPVPHETIFEESEA